MDGRKEDYANIMLWYGLLFGRNVNFFGGMINLWFDRSFSAFVCVIYPVNVIKSLSAVEISVATNRIRIIARL